MLVQFLSGVAFWIHTLVEKFVKPLNLNPLYYFFNQFDLFSHYLTARIFVNKINKTV